MSTLTAGFAELLRTWPADDPALADACRMLIQFWRQASAPPGQIEVRRLLAPLDRTV